MKYNFTDGTLTLFLEGRLQSNNAPKVREEAFLLLNEHKPDAVVLDCEDLHYISSSGLRILLEIGKEYKKLSIINVAPEVYEILDLSGFTSMFEIKAHFHRGAGGRGAAREDMERA